VGQQKSYVNEIVRGVIVPFEDVTLPEFNIAESFLYGAIASEVDFHSIHIDANHMALRPGETRNLKRDIACTTA